MVSPSVVHITTLVTAAGPFNLNVEEIPEGTGSGFVWDRDGHIVTNFHVIRDASAAVILFADGSSWRGRLVGAYPAKDLAVLAIDAPASRLQPIALGSATDLQVGQMALAIGNPFGLDQTLTTGVVSALDREMASVPGRVIRNMIQTDAAINPGNSGGPLVNAPGEVVGINSSIFSSSGGSIGLGFAIPIERAVRVADEIVRNGTVRRAWTGLEVAGARSMADWKRAGGVTVTSVAPGGPAARAAIRAGDVLTEANGRPLRNYLDWEAVKLDLHVGDAVTVGVRGEAGIARRRIVTGDLPTVTAEKVTILRDLELVSVTPAIQAERELRTTDGALIYRVSAEVSRATGLQAGDVIIGVNRTRVREAAHLAALLRSMQPRQPFRITFERDGVYNFVDLTF
jgi:S1-C subfamily serine protease